MNREIKFRMWNDYDKKMIHWNELLEKNLANIFTIPSYNKWLMQYTGLHDKNGKEIYEGDIVLITRRCILEKGEVKFINGCFAIKSKDTLLMLYQCEINNFKLEIIGNIYDNPNLLEKGAEE